MFRSISALVFLPLLIAWLLPVASANDAWKVELFRGRTYVEIADVKQFYGFTNLSINDKAIALDHPQIKVRARIWSKEFTINGLKYNFSFKVERLKGKVMVSTFDLTNLLDPVLRPMSGDHRPTEVKTIVLDPGHGGKDAGRSNGYGKEKDITLAVALKMKPLLEAAGLEVILTRSGDTDLTIARRSRLTNATDPASIYIGLQVDLSTTSSYSKGVATFVVSPSGTPPTHAGDDWKIDRNVYLGNMHDSANIALATTIQGTMRHELKTWDRGIQRTSTPELRRVNRPGIHVSLGFLSNAEEGKKLVSSSYQQQLAKSIVSGVRRYQAVVKQRRDHLTQARKRKNLMGFGEITLAPEELKSIMALTLPIKKLASGSLDPSKVDIQIFGIDLVNDSYIDQTVSDPPSLHWLSILPNWSETDTEVLAAKYIHKPFAINEQKKFGIRQFYGMVVRLIYDGELQDTFSYPPSLKRSLKQFTPVFP